MKNLGINDIKRNDKLFSFCTRIINISNMLKDEKIRYFYLVALISSDNLVDAESCESSIERQEFIVNNIDLMDLDDKLKKEVLKYVKKGLRIAKRDLKLFKNQNKQK